MDNKERLKLDKTDSLAELKKMVKQVSLTEHSYTTDSFSESTIEKNNIERTENSERGIRTVKNDKNIEDHDDIGDEDHSEHTQEYVLPTSFINAISQLVEALVEEYTQPKQIPKLKHNYNIDAQSLKKRVYENKNDQKTEELNEKNKKDALIVVKINTIIDKIKNKVDSILIKDFDKIILTAQKGKNKYKICQIPYDKDILIDDLINALDNYKDFEYVAHTKDLIVTKFYIIYIKLEYIWT